MRRRLPASEIPHQEKPTRDQHKDQEEQAEHGDALSPDPR
jgi:hypothetical protein